MLLGNFVSKAAFSVLFPMSFTRYVCLFVGIFWDIFVFSSGNFHEDRNSDLM